MITIVCLLALFISFSFHIYVLFLYIVKRKNNYIKSFINTAILNLLIAGALIYLALKKPDMVRLIDFKKFLWLFAGVVMVMMLIAKIAVLRRIYKRAQNPQHFHLNFFGKKVLHPTVVKPYEVLIFFMTMPFFLIAGAYFITKLIYYIKG